MYKASEIETKLTWAIKEIGKKNSNDDRYLKDLKASLYHFIQTPSSVDTQGDEWSFSSGRGQDRFDARKSSAYSSHERIRGNERKVSISIVITYFSVSIILLLFVLINRIVGAHSLISSFSASRYRTCRFYIVMEHITGGV